MRVVVRVLVYGFHGVVCVRCVMKLIVGFTFVRPHGGEKFVGRQLLERALHCQPVEIGAEYTLRLRLKQPSIDERRFQTLKRVGYEFSVFPLPVPFQAAAGSATGAHTRLRSAKMRPVLFGCILVGTGESTPGGQTNFPLSSS